MCIVNMTNKSSWLKAAKRVSILIAKCRHSSVSYFLGIFYTGPYTGTSFARLYDALKRNALEKGVVRPEEFGMPADIRL